MRPKWGHDQTVIVEPKDIREVSRFKGYDDFWVQDLVVETKTTQHRLKIWRTLDGQFVSGLIDVSDEAPAIFYTCKRKKLICARGVISAVQFALDTCTDTSFHDLKIIA